MSGAALSGEVLHLQACLHAQSTDHCRVAVVRLTGNSLNPFQIFAWRSTPAVMSIPGNFSD
jgi:hypothetical protein